MLALVPALSFVEPRDYVVSQYSSLLGIIVNGAAGKASLLGSPPPCPATSPCTQKHIGKQASSLQVPRDGSAGKVT